MRNRGDLPGSGVGKCTVVVTTETEGSLDRAVRALVGATWGRSRAWIRAGKVTVGGEQMLDPSVQVRKGDAIAVDPHARKRRNNELASSDIVYVDSQVVVAIKPAGVNSVPYEARETDAFDARVRRWLERHGGSRGGSRPGLGIVHRLDKETSGLMVFARTWASKTHLASQFRAHGVHRRYLAIVSGEMRGPRTFRSWLVEDRGDGLRGSARGHYPSRAASAREAVTHVEPIEAFVGATLVACRLETGRTHQIRIHLSEAGFPVAGERVYVRGHHGPLIEAPRLMLHAAELGFVHPTTEQAMHWQEPLPSDMTTLVERLRRASRPRPPRARPRLPLGPTGATNR